MPAQRRNAILTDPDPPGGGQRKSGNPSTQREFGCIGTGGTRGKRHRPRCSRPARCGSRAWGGHPAGVRGPATAPERWWPSALTTPVTVLHLFATLLAAADDRRRAARCVRRAGCPARPAREAARATWRSSSSTPRGRWPPRPDVPRSANGAVPIARRLSATPGSGGGHHLRGSEAGVLLPPTSSAHIAGRRLARFDTGGGTPRRLD